MTHKKLLGFILFSSALLVTGFVLIGETQTGGLSKNAEENGNEMEFREEVVYSETADNMFGSLFTATAGQSGRVFLGDNDQRLVHVMNADGSYHSSFGGPGSGPGEFQMISKIAVDDNYVHIFDMIQSKIHLFDAGQYRFVRTLSLDESGGVVRRGTEAGSGLGRAFDIHLLTDGNYLVLYRNFANPTGNRNAIVSATGEVLEKEPIEFHKGDEAVVQSTSGNTRVFANFPFSRSVRVTVSPEGILYSNWSGDFTFDLYNESGTRIRSFSHPHQSAKLNRSDVLNMYENREGTRVVMGSGGGGGTMPSMTQMLQNMELPETWPAVSSIYADKQNRLWVSSFSENMSERNWFLFDDSGSLLGTFTWPAGKSVVYADGDKVYVLSRDPEELDFVTRYGIKW